MKQHFRSQRDAARFVVAVESVTGQEAEVSRTEPDKWWRVEVPALTPDEVMAVSVLLESGIPPTEVTRAAVEGKLAQWQREREEREAAEALRPPVTPRPLTEQEAAEFRTLLQAERLRGGRQQEKE